MSIQTHIAGVFRDRLNQHSAMIVYDPDERYADICTGLANDHTVVVNAGASYFEAREQVMRALRDCAAPNEAGHRRYLLVYVPAAGPVDEVGMIGDPYYAVAVAGGYFPKGDGESYEALCRTAMPDHANEIARIFQESEPSFATIDALNSGGGWPQLKTVLGAESPAEILRSFMAPSSDKTKRMNEDEAWVSEIRRFLEKSLGVTLRTKGKRWKSISEEVWEIMLLSEFVSDLPGEIPEAMAQMQVSHAVAKDLVNQVCSRLRNDRSAQETYLKQADRIATAFQLATHTADVEDLGERDTFAFEERCFLQRYISSVMAGELDVAREIDRVHGNSIWLQDSNCFAQWTIARNALELVAVCADTERAQSGQTGNLAELVSFYTSSGREVDRHYRELEQAVSDSFPNLPVLDVLVRHAQEAYRTFASGLQAVFMGHFEQEGWPVEGIRSNTRVFDEVVAPLLEDRKKVAYIMIDALRYELGVELHKKLQDEVPAILSTSCAQLPTITPIGMSSLLPKASEVLAVRENNKGKLTPCMGEMFTPSAPERGKYFQSIYGDRFMDIDLQHFVHNKNLKIPETTQLLTIRSWELDRMLHNSPSRLVRVIPDYLSLIQASVHRLQTLGFDKAVVVTDHGFLLLSEFLAGDSGAKPEGQWKLKKDRCLLGVGAGDAANVVVDKEHVGIRGDFEQYATPKHLSLYKREEVYFHSGASLQETILPVIVMDLKQEADGGLADEFHVALSYRKGETTEVTTLAPMVELGVMSSGLFSQASSLEIRLEILNSAKGAAGRVAASGEHVSAATGSVTIPVGKTVKVRLRLDDDHRGPLIINALDPHSRVLHHSLKLNVKITE